MNFYRLISQREKYKSKGGISGRKSKTGHIGVTFLKTTAGPRWKASKYNNKTKKYYFQKTFHTKEEAINYYNTQVALLPENNIKRAKYTFDDKNRLVINNKIIIFKIKKAYGGQDNNVDENIIWKEFPGNNKYLVSNTGLVKHKSFNR